MPVVTPKSVFYHIPKTGGTSIVDYLTKYIDNAEDIHKDHKHKFNLRFSHTTPEFLPQEDKFSYGFVRDPLTWYQSYWKYKMQHPGGWEDNYDKGYIIAEQCRSNNFHTFIENCLREFPHGLVTTIYREYSDIDYMGHQETLEDDLIEALTLAGEEFIERDIRSFPKQNVSKPREDCNYTKELKEKIKETEAWVYDKFY